MFVLSNPPWQGPRPKERRPPTLTLTPLSLPISMDWAEGQLEEELPPPYYDTSPATSRKHLNDLRADIAKYANYPYIQGYIDSWWVAVRLNDADLRTAWDEAPLAVWRANTALQLLGRLGLDIVDRYIELAVLLKQPTTSRLLMPVVSVQAAGPMALGFVGKRSRHHAEPWLKAHPEHAATGLVPLALGKKGKEKDAATAALRVLDPAVVLEVARRYDAEDAVQILLDHDPTKALPKKVPKLPSWLDPTVLPVVRRAGEPLPPSQVVALLEMLWFTTLQTPFYGVAEVRDACDAGDLARFAWALFEQWLASGQSKGDAALYALGHFGDDDVARELAVLLRRWPGDGLHQRAVKGLDVLEAIGSDVALMHLYGISQKLKFKGLKTKAAAKVQAIADRRGLTAEELADRLVPDLGLDPDGSLILDFGPRQFRVGFDEKLAPYVKDGAGKRRKSLPRPGKSDDATLAAAATSRWKGLKKDVRAVASQQLARLEDAHCAQRRWSAADFQRFFVDHPLLRHVVQRLIWGVYTDADVTLFRVAEDGTFANVDDEVFSLSDDAVVGIVHALDVPEAHAAWGPVLADYAIVPPFAQLDRTTFHPTPEEVEETSLDRGMNKIVPGGAIRGLADRGPWRKGPPQDAGAIWWLERELPGQRKPAKLYIEPGLWASGGAAEDQTLGEIELPVPAGELAAVVFSELVRDVVEL